LRLRSVVFLLQTYNSPVDGDFVNRGADGCPNEIRWIKINVMSSISVYLRSFDESLLDMVLTEVSPQREKLRKLTEMGSRESSPVKQETKKIIKMLRK